MASLEETVATLAARVQRLEDELAIHRLIVRYGLGVDVGDPGAAANVFRDDGVYDVDVGLMTGRGAVEGMVRSERHQAMVGHCAHQIGPAVVELRGPDAAVATGYSRVYLQTPAGTHVYRVSLNRWELAKTREEWRIARRTTRVLGHAEAAAIFRRFVDEHR